MKKRKAKFRVGQVVVLKPPYQLHYYRIKSIERNNRIWRYSLIWGDHHIWRESELRPLTARERGAR